MINQAYLRNIVFGFEDGFVSTVGALVGIAASGPHRSFVIVSGLVIIAVEAMSMGVGAYLTEKSVHEMPRAERRDRLVLDGVLMWTAYMVAGLVSLSPYILIHEIYPAAVVSISLTLFGLFSLGFAKAKLINRPPFKSGLEMMLIAGVAISVGLGVGALGRSLLVGVTDV